GARDRGDRRRRRGRGRACRARRDHRREVRAGWGAGDGRPGGCALRVDRRGGGRHDRRGGQLRRGIPRGAVERVAALAMPAARGRVRVAVHACRRRDGRPADDGGGPVRAGGRVILCVAPSPSIDKLFEVDRVEIGRIHRPSAFVAVPGGKGLNVTRSAHALGAEVVATGFLAGHAGRWVEEALAAEGVRARFAWVAGETRSSLSVADGTERGLTEFYETGPDVGDGWTRLERIVGELLPAVRWMTISGSLPPGAPEDGYVRLVRAARVAGVSAALDTRDEPLAVGVAAGPEVVKGNAEEAGALLGFPVDTLGDAVRAATELRRRLEGDGRAAIVTRGAEGAVVVTP